MQRFGLKYFVGSFMLSLAAVFAVTKAYFVLAADESAASARHAEVLPAKNIELFAANEENDPLYEKFSAVNSHSALPADETSAAEEQIAFASDEVLYEPQESDAPSAAAALSEEEDTDLVIAEASEIAESPALTGSGETAEPKEENLQIADAATAPVFRIPLVHNYKTENGTITYADSADENQIAMASADVNIDNLGTDTAAAVTEPLKNDNGFVGQAAFSDGLAASGSAADEPWMVAEVANKHIGKNSLNTHIAEHQDNIAAPDQAVAVQPHEEYKMQENILVPMPESIKNERNLTPQFSTSKENLKLERELRARHELPPLSEHESISGDDDEEDTDVDEDDEASKSLTESIAKWFSGTTDKKDASKPSDEQNADKKSQKNSSSIFNKLLGIGKGAEDGIAPSELKLSFQPNRAEISGQTLEWLHAFSANSVNNEDVFIEIRIDKSTSYALQEKRLKLLYKILASNGVDYHKINIIFTDREPNSFIIRNIKYASEDDKIKAMKRADNPWY